MITIHPGGVNSISIEAGNIKQVYEKLDALKAQGVEFINIEVPRATDHLSFCDLHDLIIYLKGFSTRHQAYIQTDWTEHALWIRTRWF